MEQIKSTVDDLQKRFESLTPAPRISNSLKALVTEGNINPDEIIALIRLEPLLATRIMREANQANAKEGGFTSIEQAATAVGFERMYDLLGIYSYQYSSEAGSGMSYTPEAWKRAITCAVCMESLAIKHKLDPHEAYSIGLLHSLVPAISEACEIIPGNSRATDTYGRLNARLKSFGSSGLSYTLFRDWGFPDTFTDPVRFQYSPLDCITTGKMACLLNLSKWITGVIREYDELPDQEMGPDLLVLNLLGEGEQTLWNLVTEVSDSLQRADFLLQGKRCAA